MKKIVTLLLILSLAGVMTTTAAAASDNTENGNSTSASAADTVQINACASYGGFISGTADGSEPADDEIVETNVTINPDKGSLFVLRAKEIDGYKFIGWKEDDKDYIFSDEYILTLEAENDMDVTALFEYNRVSINACASYGGFIAGTADGSEPADDKIIETNVTINPDKGSLFVLKAKEIDGYKFIGWKEDDKDYIFSDEYILTLEAENDMDVTALFEYNRVSINACASYGGYIAGTADGSELADDKIIETNVTINPDKGSLFVLRAKEIDGYKFIGWKEDDKDYIFSDEYILTLEAENDMDVTALFEYNRVSINACASYGGYIAGTADGSELADDKIIETNVTINPDKGSLFVLRAKEIDGYKFIGWKEDDKDYIFSDDYILTLEAENDMDVTALFEYNEDSEEVFIRCDRDGIGFIAFSNDGTEPVIDYNDSADMMMIEAEKGDKLIFRAEPGDGCSFKGWRDNKTGNIISTNEIFSFDASEDMDISAVFSMFDMNLVSIEANTKGGGQVAGSIDGNEPQFDPDDPKNSYYTSIPNGGKVVITAKADEGYVFGYWFDEDTKEYYSFDPTITIKATHNLNLTAVFESKENSILVTAKTQGCGQLAHAIDGYEIIFDKDNPTYELEMDTVQGMSIAIKAKPDNGWKFDHWINADTGEVYSKDAIICIDVEENINLIAVFSETDRIKINIYAEGFGCFAYSDDGNEPSDDHTVSNYGINLTPGSINAIKIKAIADEGYVLGYWMDSDTHEFYSFDQTLTIVPKENLDITAVFEEIGKEHTIITDNTVIDHDINDNIVIRTNSQSDTVFVQIEDSIISSDDTEGLSIEDGIVTISNDLANSILKDGENNLRLAFADGELDVTVFTDEITEPVDDPATDDPATDDPATDDPATDDPATDDPATNDPAKTIKPSTDTPKTGSAAAAAGVSAVLLGSAAAAIALGKKRKKDKQE